MNSTRLRPIRNLKKCYLARSMERTDFIDRISQPDLLKGDSAADWKKLSEKYPYASLVQLMYYQQHAAPTPEMKKELALFFDNPLHLAMLTRGGGQPMNEVDPHEKLVREAVLSENTVTVTSKTVSVAMGEALLKEQAAVKPVEEKRVEAAVDKKKNDPTIPTAPTTPLTEKEDVLELINELPEENPIKKSVIPPTTEAPDSDAPSKEEIPQEAPGNLMVMMSFTDWLQFYKAKNENDAADKKGRDAIRSAWQKEKLAEAMDDEDDVVPEEIFEKAMKSVSFGDNLVTEPLAELYAKQGKTEKAIELYKKLSLLNPEKRSYFAAKIKNLHL